MKICDIKKKYDNFSLSISSLEIQKGKIYGIIGPNGCGKTTVMKILAGIIAPDSGYVDNEGLTAQDITMIFRKPYLLHDTVLNNLLYPLKIRKIKPDMEQVDNFLDMTGLQNLRNEYALSLSGGEQQKLSLIRALIFSPKFILVDEGFSNMDIESVAFFENYILDLQKSKPLTWVIVSHQLSNIKRLCEQVFFMHNGEICVSGPTDSVLSSPETKELKQYLQYV